MSGVKGKSGIYTRTEQGLRNLSLALKGRTVWNKGKSLHYSVWNKGKVRTEMLGNKFAVGNEPNKTSFIKGKRVSVETEFKKSEMALKQEGNRNSNWRGGLTPLQRLERIAGRGKPSTCEACKREGVICFDHDHKSGKFRGWICSKCNFALGNLNDDPVILTALVDYLKNVH